MAGAGGDSTAVGAAEATQGRRALQAAGGIAGAVPVFLVLIAVAFRRVTDNPQRH